MFTDFLPYAATAALTALPLAIALHSKCGEANQAWDDADAAEKRRDELLLEIDTVKTALAAERDESVSLANTVRMLWDVNKGLKARLAKAYEHDAKGRMRKVVLELAA